MLGSIRLLLPALIPSWRFFKTVEPSPRIEYRTSPDAPWMPVAQAAQSLTFLTAATQLFWNPRRNEDLFLVTLSERAASADADFPKAELDRRLAQRLDLAPGTFGYRVIFVTKSDHAELFRSRATADFEQNESPHEPNAAPGNSTSLRAAMLDLIPSRNR